MRWILFVFLIVLIALFCSCDDAPKESGIERPTSAVTDGSSGAATDDVLEEDE